ncbi:C-GCAxxG-C-C family protein [Acetobacterium carbinolicum]|jgi:C_GCAxxG_C_C family probable redox protein|uniref:C-GCAxxG-C-C family protein n=1 Tax=Acetobacterium carbinolicum TaxID=52690 RepID=UPI0029E27AAA|nr:hypothetical protein [Acetobacterium sp.]
MNNEKNQLVNDYAIENFKNGLNCAESVYDALIRAGVLDVPKETVAMCTGFGGGIGLCGETCGALSAAVMANSAVHGRKDPWSIDSDVRGAEVGKKYYRRYNNLVREFKEANGCTTCRNICEPFDDWHGKDRRVHCMKLIGATAQLAYHYLQIPQEEAFEMPYGEKMGATIQK